MELQKELIQDDDIERYAVIRFAPASKEIVIDLMGKVGEVSYARAEEGVEEVVIEGVKIPLCGLDTLIETKKGLRPKDKEDRLFLTGKKGSTRSGDQSGILIVLGVSKVAQAF